MFWEFPKNTTEAPHIPVEKLRSVSEKILKQIKSDHTDCTQKVKFDAAFIFVMREEKIPGSEWGLYKKNIRVELNRIDKQENEKMQSSEDSLEDKLLLTEKEKEKMLKGMKEFSKEETRRANGEGCRLEGLYPESNLPEEEKQ